jgi:transposase
MKTPTRFIKPLGDEQRTALKQLMQTHPNHRVRMRAHAVLLSDRRYSLDQIADIFEVDRDTVRAWLLRWDDDHTDGLDDDPRPGRPATLSTEETAQALEPARQEPRAPHHQLSALTQQTGKAISRATLKRLLKRAGLRWKRMRRSLRARRDEAAFRAAQAAVKALQRAAACGTCDLYYYDEAGFSLTPCVPYAWQATGARLEIASTRSVRRNVPAFPGWKQAQFHPFVFTGAVDTDLVVHCFETLSRLIEKETWVIMDNAPTHTAEEFDDQLDEWERRGLHVFFLPPYCPELNLIELLWRKIKYEWLPISAYESYKAFVQALDEVLSQVGSKYQITFA